LINVTVLEDEDILKRESSFFSQYRVVCATGISFPRAVRKKNKTKQNKTKQNKTKFQF